MHSTKYMFRRRADEIQAHLTCSYDELFGIYYDLVQQRSAILRLYTTLDFQNNEYIPTTPIAVTEV